LERIARAEAPPTRRTLDFGPGGRALAPLDWAAWSMPNASRLPIQLSKNPSLRQWAQNPKINWSLSSARPRAPRKFRTPTFDVGAVGALSRPDSTPAIASAAAGQLSTVSVTNAGNHTPNPAFVKSLPVNSGYAICSARTTLRLHEWHCFVNPLTRKLDSLLGSSGSSNSGPRKGKKRGPKAKRKMSAAARARISAAAKRRWKAAKAAGKSRL
jgi:hypothetical protein